MRRKRPIYQVGDHWLDQRAESPFYQIRWYDAATRTTRNRSTACVDLDDAKAAIHAFVEAQRAEGRQDPMDAAAVPLLLLYWKERGSKAHSRGQIASSLRQFIAFLRQDRKTGDRVTVAKLTGDVFTRFREWRKGPHGYSIPWGGKVMTWSSAGVSGEAIQRNLDDVRSALNWQVKQGRLPYAPKVPAVPSEDRSPPRDIVLTIDQLGAMLGYALDDPPLLFFIVDQIATAARPDAVLKWRVADQLKAGGLYDTHPKGAARTKKRNPVVPVPLFWGDWLQVRIAGQARDGRPIASMKRRWRTMRAALDLPAEIVPKTIRHTMATELRRRKVPKDDIAGLLGHQFDNATSGRYAHYDPTYLAEARSAIDAVWLEAMFAARSWSANHQRHTGNRSGPTRVVLRDGNAL